MVREAIVAGRSSVDMLSKNIDGDVTYNGDRGQHTVQISESLNVATGIDGGSALMRVETFDAAGVSTGSVQFLILCNLQ